MKEVNKRAMDKEQREERDRIEVEIIMHMEGLVIGREEEGGRYTFTTSMLTVLMLTIMHSLLIFITTLYNLCSLCSISIHHH